VRKNERVVARDSAVAEWMLLSYVEQHLHRPRPLRMVERVERPLERVRRLHQRRDVDLPFGKQSEDLREGTAARPEAPLPPPSSAEHDLPHPVPG